MDFSAFAQLIEHFTGLAPEWQSKALNSTAVILTLWITQRLIKVFLLGGVDDLKSIYRLKKFISYTAFCVGMFLVGKIWFVGMGALATFFGLLGAGLAIAFKDPLVNLAGWAFILIRRPFEVGDRIQMGNHQGDVIDQRLFTLTLLEIGEWVDAEQSTGRIIMVPNGLVFTEPVANFYKGFEYVWIEVPVLVTFESDWKQAKIILSDIADTHAIHLSKAAEKKVKVAAQKIMIFYKKLTPVVYTTVRDSGVLLTIRCLCEPRRRRKMEEDLWEAILQEFSQHDTIDFAYPSQRFYYNALEGKPGARSAGVPLEVTSK